MYRQDVIKTASLCARVPLHVSMMNAVNEEKLYPKHHEFKPCMSLIRYSVCWKFQYDTHFAMYTIKFTQSIEATIEKKRGARKMLFFNFLFSSDFIAFSGNSNARR